MCLQPRNRCLVGVLLIKQDRTHDFVFHGQRDGEVLQQSADIRAVLRITSAGVGLYGGATEVWSENIIAAFKIFHLEFGVHRMRFPAQEHEVFVLLRCTLDFSQHALLA